MITHRRAMMALIAGVAALVLILIPVWALMAHAMIRFWAFTGLGFIGACFLMAMGSLMLIIGILLS